MAAPRCTVLSLAGTDEEAKLLVERELERIAKELERDEESSKERGTQEKIFTAYLWPSDSEYDLRTLADDLTPIQFPWGTRACWSA